MSREDRISILTIPTVMFPPTVELFARPTTPVTEGGGCRRKHVIRSGVERSVARRTGDGAHGEIRHASCTHLTADTVRRQHDRYHGDARGYNLDNLFL